MTLETNLKNFATRAATEDKKLRVLINANAVDLSGLTTTAKSSLLAAINEVNDAVKNAAQSGGASINDSAATASTAYSGQKVEQVVAKAKADLLNGAPDALDTLKELADALANKSDVSAVTNLLANKVDKTAVGNTDVDLVTAFEAALK